MVKKYPKNLEKYFQKPKVSTANIQLLLNYSKSLELKKSKKLTFLLINN